LFKILIFFSLLLLNWSSVFIGNWEYEGLKMLRFFLRFFGFILIFNLHFFLVDYPSKNNIGFYQNRLVFVMFNSFLKKKMRDKFWVEGGDSNRKFFKHFFRNLKKKISENFVFENSKKVQHFSKKITLEIFKRNLAHSIFWKPYFVIKMIIKQASIKRKWWWFWEGSFRGFRRRNELFWVRGFLIGFA